MIKLAQNKINFFAVSNPYQNVENTISTQKGTIGCSCGRPLLIGHLDFMLDKCQTPEY